MPKVTGKHFRVAFLGRGILGSRVLEGLLNDHDIEVPVIMTCRSSPEVGYDEGHFQQIAEQHKIPFFKTNNINKTEWIRELSQLKADLAVAMLWVNTIGEDVIATTRMGFLNCHGGMLPRYRGNACFNWAILNCEKEVGLTVHLMEPGKLDSGPIVLQEKIAINDDSTIGALTNLITQRGPEMVLEAVRLLRTGKVELRPQDDGQALYCYPRLPRDGEIDWNKPAPDVLRLVRAAGDPYPGAYSYFADVRDHSRIKKLVIDEASIEDHPTDFCAVPGHILKLDGGARRAVVCGDKRLLVLDQIRIDGSPAEPASFFRSVRQRLGLDTEALLAEIKAQAIQEPHALVERFVQGDYRYVEGLCESVNSVVEPVNEKLESEFDCVALNPIRNYSFQKRFYDWEQRERWFGIQIYRSLRFKCFPEEALAMGYWLFSETDQGLRQRVFVSMKSICANLSGKISELVGAVFRDASLRNLTQDGSAGASCFVDVTGSDPSLLQGRMVELGRQIARLGNNANSHLSQE